MRCEQGAMAALCNGFASGFSTPPAAVAHVSEVVPIAAQYGRKRDCGIRVELWALACFQWDDRHPAQPKVGA